MTYRTIFDAKISSQDCEVVFDFTGQLFPEESLAWATVAAAVYSGTDANPSSLISGSAVIDGGKVTQKLVGGVQGTTYALGCSVSTDLVRPLAKTGYLSVIGPLS